MADSAVKASVDDRVGTRASSCHHVDEVFILVDDRICTVTGAPTSHLRVRIGGPIGSASTLASTGPSAVDVCNRNWAEQRRTLDPNQ